MKSNYNYKNYCNFHTYLAYALIKVTMEIYHILLTDVELSVKVKKCGLQKCSSWSNAKKSLPEFY